MITQLTTLIITSLIVFGVTSVHADHVDNHIWIETADGNFTPLTENIHTATLNLADINNHGDHKCNVLNTYYTIDIAQTKQTETVELITEMIAGFTNHLERTEYDRIINNHVMVQNYGGCGNEADERKTLNEFDKDNIVTTSFNKWYHECFCAYWYSNTIENEYTYTVTDLPDRRELPLSYEREVKEANTNRLRSMGRRKRHNIHLHRQ